MGSEKSSPVAAASLQRSAETFRRSGSSGLVWENRFASAVSKDSTEGKDGKEEFRELRHSRSTGSTRGLERNRSTGGGRAFATGKVSPALDPPSPKVSGCGFCGIFGKPTTPANRSKPTPANRSKPTPANRSKPTRRH